MENSYSLSRNKNDDVMDFNLLYALQIPEGRNKNSQL